MKTYLLHPPQSRPVSSFSQKLEGRKAIDVLAGLCLGVLADGEINSREAAFLKDWILLNATSLPAFVLTKLIPKLNVLQTGADAPIELLQELAKLLSTLVGLDEPSENGDSDLASSAGRPSKLLFDDLDEPITFRGLEIVVTGNFANFSRAEIMNQLLELGALPRDAPPTLRTELVVVGQKGSLAWTSRHLGSKIEKALELRQAGQDIKILSEESFLARLTELQLEPRSGDNLPGHGETCPEDLPLSGKTFVITGSLSIDRDDMKALIEANGGKVSGSISAKTHYLLAGDGGGSKRIAAEKLKVPIIDENELHNLIGAAS